jgi:protein translocase SecG subunit
MLVEFLSTLFFIFNIFLIILIVMQKNHGGFWSGPAGTDSVNIFGGNQGADVLQKITWVFGAILIFGSLFLSVYQASQSQISQFYLSEVKEEIMKKEKENENNNTENDNGIITENKENVTEENTKTGSDNSQLKSKENRATKNTVDTQEKIKSGIQSKSNKKNIEKKTVANNKQKK